MAPYAQGQLSKQGIKLTDQRSSKSKSLKFKKGKLTATPRRITFQRKLIVIRYMGEKPPKHFTLKDSVVALRGVLPEIDIEASELDVRREIAGVIVNSGEEFAACSKFSFEFIEATGKHLYVPAKPAGFQWSGKAIKHLAGNGKVYVRLLYDPISSSESEDLPVFQPRPRSEKASGCGPSSCVLVSPIYVVLCAKLYNGDRVCENQP